MTGGMTLVLALCLGLAEAPVPGVAHADVDASGSWQLTFSPPAGTQDAIFAQSATSLSVALGGGRDVFSGSIDPVTGQFVLSATLLCNLTSPPTPVPFTFSGTISADGSTLQGTFGETNPLPPNVTCAVPTLSVAGSRLSTTCGNGTIDAGEECDPGPPPSGNLCCTLACAAAPSGTACTDDGLLCTTDACDGSGTCTHQPGNAGIVCRPQGPPCDVAEVCDGVNATCPADQTTCPPPDIDVTGTWRVNYVYDLGGQVSADQMLVQDGVSLVFAGTPGSLDPVTRQFEASAFTPGQVLPCFVGFEISGTFSADGESFTGNADSVFEHVTPPIGCLDSMATVSGVRIATSPDCGNGVIDPGEECDPGIAGSGCCYVDCQLRPASAICRAASSSCDAPERCDGVSAACPPAQPTGPDSDGDGIPDPCDPCAAGAAVTKPRFQATGDKVVFSGRATVTGVAAIDPIAHGVRLAVTDAAGGSYLDVSVPGGALVNRTGWKASKKGWSFTATTPVGGVITSVKLTVKDGTGVTFKIAGKHASLPPVPGSLPVRATLVLDPPQSTDRCVETPFPGPPHVAPSCTLKRDGTELSCR